MSALGYTTRSEGRYTFITINGIERKHSEWAALWGVTAPCVAARLRAGFPLPKLMAGKTANRYAGVRAPSKAYLSTPHAPPSVEAAAVAAYWFKAPVPGRSA